jgi:alpha-1,3-fucosyltransferase 10
MHFFICLQDYLPSKKSAVLVNDFDDVKDLAELIQYLDKNDTAYEEYLHFKERNGITNTFLTNELNNREWSKYDDLKRPYWSFFSGFECYICEQIHENIDAINSGKRIHTKIAKLEHYGCPPPKRFNSKGKYIIDDPRYSHHWYEGKYRAKAFRYFYDNSLNFTENSITELSQSLRKEYNENR